MSDKEKEQIEEEQEEQEQQEENQEEDNQQEIDYKAEYEKMIAERDRKDILTNLEKSLYEKGYPFNEGELSKIAEEFDNNTLKEFIKLVDKLGYRPTYIFEPGEGSDSNGKSRITFEDVINK